MAIYKLTIETLRTGKHIFNDRDNVLLHASFQILKDFVEEEKPFLHNGSPQDNPQLVVIKDLYDWWMKRRNKGLSNDKKQYIEDDEMLSKLLSVRKWLWV